MSEYSREEIERERDEGMRMTRTTRKRRSKKGRDNDTPSPTMADRSNAPAGQAEWVTLGINSQTDSGLGSCPFCGSPVERTTIYGDFMECYPSLFECTNHDCGARVMFPMAMGRTKEMEEDLWNRRASE